jgi:hypothetical protein
MGKYNIPDIVKKESYSFSNSIEKSIGFKPEPQDVHLFLFGLRISLIGFSVIICFILLPHLSQYISIIGQDIYITIDIFYLN